MKRIVLAFGLVVSICCFPAFSLSSDWENITQEGKGALKAGKFADAEKLFRQALVEAGKFPASDLRLIETFSNLADAQKAAGNLDGAEENYRQAVAVAEKVRGPVHGDVATCLNNLAACLFAQGRHSDAESLSLKALAIDDRVYGETGKQLLPVLNNLAELYKAIDRNDEAEKIYKRALDIAEKNFGPDSKEVAAACGTLASFHRKAKRYRKAAPLYSRVLEITERIHGPEHPEVAASLSNLGHNSKGSGDYAAAEANYKRALAIFQKCFGGKDNNSLREMCNLAKIYMAQKKLRESEVLLKQIVDIDEENAVWDLEAAKDLQAYASILRQTDREEEAEDLETKAYVIMKARQ